MRFPRPLCPFSRVAVLAAVILALFGWLPSRVAANPPGPNIILILADDLGYGDVRSYNPQGKIATPNLDRLAAEGCRFTDAHTSSSVCSPTRYGLLTGRYNWRSRLKRGVLGGLSPRLIEMGRETVASLLHRSGYRTACIGKWHLGLDWVRRPGLEVTELNIEPREQVWNVDYGQPFQNGPLSVGFDEYFGISASLDMVPYTFLRNDRVVALPTEDRSFMMMSGREGQTTRQGPTAPGFEAEQVLPALEREAVAFLERQAEHAAQGKPFFLYLPLTAPHTPILPTKDWSGKSHLNPYADFVMQTDAVVGSVLAALDRHQLARDTLVIVTSDNGCSPQAQFPELAALGHHPSHQFRGHKADIYEGGHRVPFLVRWPAQVAAGRASDQLICLNDVLATCAEVTGTPVPAGAGEDSVSFLPVLLKQSDRPLRTSLVHHSINGSFAIRSANWKLCLCPDSGGWSEPRPGKAPTGSPPVQLFDLAADPGERVNLANERADKVAELRTLLEKIQGPSP